MATAKKAAPKAAKSAPAAPAKKAAAAAAAPKAPKTVLSKTALNAHLAEASGQDVKAVRAVMAALEATIVGSLGKKGAGQFVLPGLAKIQAVKVAARPKRKGINPFTKQEQVFAAKPASVKVKVRAMKKLKDAAAA